MIIDSLTDKSSINIDELTVPGEETESGFTFDPRTEINENDRLEALSLVFRERADALRLKSLRLDWLGSLRGFGNVARDLKFFFPERADHLPLDSEIMGLFEECFFSKELFGLEMASLAKNLFPESATLAKFQVGFFNASMEARLRNVLVREGGVRLVMGEAAIRQVEVKIYQPVGIDQRQWGEVLGKLREYRSSPDNGDLVGYVELAANAIIAFPQKKKDLGLDRAIWRKIQAGLNEFRGTGQWREFFDLAYYATILAADEVKITSEKGLEAVLPKSEIRVSEQTPPMPVKRAF